MANYERISNHNDNATEIPPLFSTNYSNQKMFKSKVKLDTNIGKEINKLCISLNIKPNVFFSVVWSIVLMRYNDMRSATFWTNNLVKNSAKQAHSIS